MRRSGPQKQLRTEKVSVFLCDNQIYFNSNSDYVAILDSDGQVIKTTLCRASNNSPLYVYSKKSASIFMSSDGSSADNGKGFRMRFKTLNYVPSQCGDKKYQSLASDETIHIRFAFWWRNHRATLENTFFF